MKKSRLLILCALLLALALLAGCSQTVPDPEGSVVSPEGFVPYGEEPAFVNQQYASDDTVIFYAGLLLKEKPTAPISSFAGAYLIFYDFAERRITGVIDLRAIDCIDSGDNPTRCRISEDGSKISVSQGDREYCYVYKDKKLSRSKPHDEFATRDNLTLPDEYMDQIDPKYSAWAFYYPLAHFDEGVGYLALDVDENGQTIMHYASLLYLKNGEVYRIFG